MTDAIDRGFISFGDAHELASLGRDRGGSIATTAGGAKQLALDLDRTLSDEAADELLNDRALHEAAGLVAYAHDLARRLDGVTGNPATLAFVRMDRARRAEARHQAHARDGPRRRGEPRCGGDPVNVEEALPESNGLLDATLP